MDHFVDAVDWIVWQLTWNYVRSAGATGYKALFQDGQFPSTDYFKGLNPDFENVVEEKLAAPVGQLGDKAGELSVEGAYWTGLKAGIPVSVGNIDAHVTAPPAKPSRTGS